MLQSNISVYFTGLFTSQFISNVPAAVLLSTFTRQEFAIALLQGVNVGAMGTLIGSLASLITFKFVLKEFPGETKNYLKLYTTLCVIFIIIITGVVFINRAILKKVPKSGTFRFFGRLNVAFGPLADKFDQFFRGR
ncbi:MAG: hypothetical protein MZU97_26075 [Bacillus subtilis]|nr:hypothetical protein [Bacillus subtilis]